MEKIQNCTNQKRFIWFGEPSIPVIPFASKLLPKAIMRLRKFFTCARFNQYLIVEGLAQNI